MDILSYQGRMRAQAQRSYGKTIIAEVAASSSTGVRLKFLRDGYVSTKYYKFQTASAPAVGAKVRLERVSGAYVVTAVL